MDETPTRVCLDQLGEFLSWPDGGLFLRHLFRIGICPPLQLFPCKGVEGGGLSAKMVVG